VEVHELGDARVDLVAAMAQLHELGIQRLLVEGGGSLNFELLRLGLVDELQVFVAPLIFGGAGAPTLADGEGLMPHEAVRLHRVQLEAWDDGGMLLRYMVVRT
jgi:riboflavin biosynthesis pyrimidine reductase